MDLFELSATLRMDTSEYEKAVKNAEKMAEDLSKKLDGLGKNAGKVGGGAGGVSGVASGVFGKLGSGLSKLASLGTKAFSSMANIGMKSMSGIAKAGQLAFTGVAKSTQLAVKGIETVGKVATISMGAVTALGAAFTPMIKQAVAAFGSYEQLVGGVETMFKKDAQFVIQNAKQAFATAGMSANEYMETVTVFANKLIQDLGGDTRQAAEVADMALKDMSDNVNKMGTSMEAVQNAYRGLSMGNFRMLDNLRLGYNGTRSEMERLLRDAEKYEAKNGRIVKYSIDSYADMVKAINVVQRELGITGTTAEEAETTIQGSASRMKAAWQNVMTALANPKGGIKELKSFTKEFGTSVSIYLKNLIPAVRAAINGLPYIINELTPILEKELPNLVADLLPKIVSTGVDVGIALVKGITKALKKIKIGEIFKNAKNKVKIALTDWLSLPSDANLSEIMAAFGTKLRESLKHAKDKIKIGLAELLGITGPNGAKITDADQIQSGMIVAGIITKIKEGFKAGAVGLAALLGIKGADGAVITDADDIQAGAIIDAIINKINGATGTVKIALASLLGLTGEDGAKITDADSVNWTDIADGIVNAVQYATKTVTFSLAKFLGLDNPEDATLGQVIQGLLDKAVSGLKFSNTFLKKLLIGDKAFEELKLGELRKKYPENLIQTLLKNNGDKYEPDWSEVIDYAFKDLTSELNDTSWFKDGLHVVLDLAEGIPAFVTSLITEFTKLLGQEGVGAEFGSTFAKVITDALGKAPDWITNLSNFAVDFINEFAKEENISKIFKGIANVIESLVTNSGKITKALGTALFNIIKSPDAWAAITDIIDDLLFKLPQAIADGLWAALVDGIFGEGSWSKAKNDEGFIGFLTKLLQGDVSGAFEMMTHIGDKEAVPLADKGNAQDVQTEANQPVYDTNKMVPGVAFVPGQTALSSMSPEEYNKTLESLMAYYGFNAIEGSSPYRQRMVGAFASAGSWTDSNGNSHSNYYTSVERFINDIEGLTKSDNDVLQLLMGNVRTAEASGNLEQVASALHRLRSVADLINVGIHHDPSTGNDFDLLRKIEYDNSGYTASPFGGMLTDEGYSELVTRLREVQSKAEEISKGQYEIDFKVNFPWFIAPTTAEQNNAEGHAKGLWAVPYDNYYANLHRGEMVLTASQARDYREGSSDSTGAIVAAIERLSNEIQNMKLVVGKKVFGQTVVDYSGKRMNGYIGQAENKAIAGYGWG